MDQQNPTLAKIPNLDTATGSASEGTATKKGRTVALTTEDIQKRKNDVKCNVLDSGITLYQQWELVFISSGKLLWQWEHINASGNALCLVPTGSVIVPTGRYIVPTGRYIVPTGRVIVTTGRDIYYAVKARFGGNAKSRKMRRSMLKQEFSKFRISEAEGLHKGVFPTTYEDVEGRPVFHSDKSLEVNINNLASSDSGLKSSEHKPTNSFCASTSSVSTSMNEAEIDSNVGTPIKEPISV
nr:xylulose kinase-1 [Tanacetum cinerariifolium]